MLRIAAQAVAVLALYRFSLVSIPMVWHLSDLVGALLGRLASIFCGPLSVGATFAGLDHLVLMAALIAGWAVELQRPRVRALLLAVSAVVVGQTLYLLCLSLAVDLGRLLPAPPVLPTPDPYVPPDWVWSNAVRAWLPWNVPVVAVIWHMGVVAAMLRWGLYRPAELPAEDAHNIENAPWKTWTPLAAAALLPVAGIFSFGANGLEEKTVLAYDPGNLDWKVPEHGRYGADSSGQFGMLPAFVASLGGQLHRSPNLTRDELADADLLLVIQPSRPWPEDVLARVQDYVRQGGSLLVAAGPYLQDAGGASSHNALLGPLAIPVRCDTTVSQTEAWRNSLQTSAHPATIGLGDDRDRFGMALAAPIDLPWSASPLLVGRWGWSDPGSDFLLTQRAHWDPGERLGDLVLAGQRRVGRGTVIVLGDSACLTNQGNVRTCRFTARLLSCLANKAGSPLAGWRQLVTLVLAGALIAFWTGSISIEVLAASLFVFLLACVSTESLSSRMAEVYPDGNSTAPNCLAYIDASHLGAYSESPWLPEGIDGLALTLMRDGYLVFLADDLSNKRLRRAGLLVSIAPARSFSFLEHARLQRFMEDGGVLIVMADSVHGQRANEILTQFGMQMPMAYHRPGSTESDPTPLGCLFRPYPDFDTSLAPVLLHAGWTLEMDPRNLAAESILSTPVEGQAAGEPIVACAAAGQGLAIAIADTGFAWNMTLETADGGTLSGGRHNAYFWRWLVGQLPGREPWSPPPYDWEARRFNADAPRQPGEEAQP